SVTGTLCLLLLILTFLVPALHLGLSSSELDWASRAEKVYLILVATLTGRAQFDFMFSEPLHAIGVIPYLLPLQLVGGTILAMSLIWQVRAFSVRAKMIVRAFLFVHICLLGIIASMIMTREFGGSHHAILVVPLTHMQLFLSILALAEILDRRPWWRRSTQIVGAF